MLRCILSLNRPGTQVKCHILVFVRDEYARLIYSVKNFPETLQEKLEEDLDMHNLSYLNYDDEISRTINSHERKMPGAALASLMINENFHCSYIIFVNSTA